MKNRTESREHREMIFLDAEVESVINNKAFRVRLANGHVLVAYRGGDGPALERGHLVRVRVSPFDFSRGELVDEKRTGLSS